MGLGASHCFGVWAPTEVSITTMVLAIVFMIATVPGNLMVILAVLFDPNKNLRNPFTLLVANLAVTDLIVGALVEPLSINTHYRESRGLSISMSWFSQSVYFLCCTASLLSLAALTCRSLLSDNKASVVQSQRQLWACSHSCLPGLDPFMLFHLHFLLCRLCGLRFCLCQHYDVLHYFYLHFLLCAYLSVCQKPNHPNRQFDRRSNRAK